MTNAPGTMIGRYRVRQKIAEGGMAEIYLCTFRGPEGFEKQVAIKRIRSLLAKDPIFIRMFITEAQVASRLSHANVIQIFDFGKHQDGYYLAMEYVRGRSLAATRKRSQQLMRPFSPKLAAHICVQVARGLQYVHTVKERGAPMGLVHRDITPHNILLSYQGEVKIADFGVAKEGQRSTVPGALKGKFAYMSPEQASGEDVDPRTDVFALGIVLWEMLTGVKLFHGDNDIAVLRAVRESQIAPPIRLNPDIAPELDRAVMKALQRDPRQRFQTAHQFEQALGQYLIHFAETWGDTDVAGFLRSLFPEEASLDPDAELSGSSGLGHTATASTPRTDLTIARAGSLIDETRQRRGLSGWRDGRSRPKNPLGKPSLESSNSELASRMPVWEEVSLPTSLPVREHGAIAAIARVALRPSSSGSFLSPARRAILIIVGIVVVAAIPLAAMSLRLRDRSTPGGPILPPVLGGIAAVVTPSPTARNQTEGGTFSVIPDKDSHASRRTLENRGMATLTVKVAPWAMLTIDGRQLGEVSGVRRYRLRPGRHRLRFDHPHRHEDRVVFLAKDQPQLQEYDALSN